MTDTPRTLDELLDIFADGQVHGISAQDMRDFAVSVFGSVPGTDEVALSLMAGGDFSSNSNTYSLASGVDQWLPMGVRSDPRGWVVAASYTAPYGGGTVPADSSVLLPPGVYLIGTDIVRHTGSGGADLSFRFEWVDDPSADAVYGGAAGFYPPSFGVWDNQTAVATLGDLTTTGFYRQTQAMYDAGIRIAPKLYQSSGSPVLLNYADLFIVKIAGPSVTSSDLGSIGPESQFLGVDYDNPVTVANNTSFVGPTFTGATYFSDVGRMLADAAYTSTYIGDTFAAGTYVELPAGVWAIDAFGVWASNSTGDRICEPIHIDSRLTLAANANVVNPVFGGTNEWQMLSSDVWHKASALPANGQCGTHSIFIITPDMIASSHADRASGSPWAVTFQAYQNSGGDLALNAYGLTVARIR